MRSTLRWSVGALLLGASVIACSGGESSEQRPARTTASVVPAPPPPSNGGGTVAVVHHGGEKGVTEAQPPAPAVQEPSTPMERMSEERARVSQAVALATRQIDRLTRMQDSADPDRRAQLDATLSDLQSRREKVLQDMRELELRGPALSPTTSDALRSDLYRDLGDLQSSVHDSYVVAPAPGSGMAPPAPLPP